MLKWLRERVLGRLPGRQCPSSNEQMAAPGRTPYDELLLKIASCANVERCLKGDAQHACCSIVRSQDASDVSSLQVPEPWTGHLETARLMFLSSNPSISLVEDYPTRHWTDDQIIDYFTNRFQGGRKPWISRNRCLQVDGTYQAKPTRFWVEVAARAKELYGRNVEPGHDYVLSEVVHCKSRSEFGVESALAECTNRFMKDILELSAARVVVCLGNRAQSAIRSLYDISDHGRVQSVRIAEGDHRCFCFMPHPNARMRRTVEACLTQSEARYVTSLLR